MKTTVPAVYEHGVLRPLEPVPLSEGERVSVTLEAEAPSGALGIAGADLMELFGSISPEEARGMEEAIEDAFERIDPDDWR